MMFRYRTLPNESAPCYQCSDRHLGCHTTCEQYKEYNKKLLQKKSKLMSCKGGDPNLLRSVIKTR